jgi:hypothetical protein
MRLVHCGLAVLLTGFLSVVALSAQAQTKNEIGACLNRGGLCKATVSVVGGKHYIDRATGLLVLNYVFQTQDGKMFSAPTDSQKVVGQQATVTFYSRNGETRAK